MTVFLLISFTTGMNMIMDINIVWVSVCAHMCACVCACVRVCVGVCVCVCVKPCAP